MNQRPSVIITLIFAISFVGCFFLQPVFSQPPQRLAGGCGDGVCDSFEKAHPNLCPEDCPLASENQILPYRQKFQRDYFYEVHLEPASANDEMFNVLAELVNLADKYKVKLTLLFTPQWAEMILSDSNKMNVLDRWKSEGHEVGGHHHGPNVWPWDCYSDLSLEEINNLRSFRPKIPENEAKKLSEGEKLLGNMQDFVGLLNRIAGQNIKVITSSTELYEWPDNVPYAAGGIHLKQSISMPCRVIFCQKEVIKVTSAPLLPRGKSIAPRGQRITIDQLKERFISSEPGIFGVVSHEVDYERDPGLYEEWFKFLHLMDPSGEHSYTISGIIEKHCPLSFRAQAGLR